MPRRLTSLILLVLMLSLATSGWLGWVLPAARAGLFYDLTRLCGGALRLFGLGAASLVGWQLVERAAAARARVSGRLASGSKHAGSYTGNAYPETIWLLDAVPRLAPATWRLHLTGNVERPLTLSAA